MMLEEDDGETPEALLGRPDIEPHLAPFWDAFQELSTDRHSDSMGGVGEIPFSALDRYAERFGIGDPDEFERLRHLIRAMDREYLDVVQKRRTASEKKRK